MNALPAPPTKLVHFLCILIGAAALGPLLWHLFGKPGLAIGLFLGVLLGRLLGRWVQHTFLEF